MAAAASAYFELHYPWDKKDTEKRRYDDVDIEDELDAYE